MFGTPFYAPILTFRAVKATAPRPCPELARTITAGNFPPVMVLEPQNVSNESHVQSWKR